MRIFLLLILCCFAAYAMEPQPGLEVVPQFGIEFASPNVDDKIFRAGSIETAEKYMQCEKFFITTFFVPSGEEYLLIIGKHGKTFKYVIGSYYEGTQLSL